MSVFKRNTSFGQTQGESVALSPYDRARREWDDRIGSARVQAFHWRLTAVLSLTAVLGLTAGLVHLSANKEVKTYVIEVDVLGRPATITLTDATCQPSSAQSAYAIRQLVTLVRSRPQDPVVVRENWKTAYGFLAGEAIHTMNAYANADPPIRVVNGRPLARTVAISNVLQKSRRTYQVRWIETSFIDGVPQRPEAHTGLFEIETIPPRDEAEVFRNPLGIYVVSFSWSREFTEPIVNGVEPADTPATSSHEETTDE